MKRIFTASMFVFLFSALLMTPWTQLEAQTTIDFDNNDNWTSGSGRINGYQTDHIYQEGLFSATGGEARRQTDSDKNGYPGALGSYAWCLRDRSSVEWTITIASGGVGNFTLDIRRWDEDPTPDYDLEFSVNGGDDWTLVEHIDNEVLDNSNAWKTFRGTINSSNDEIQVRLKATAGTERIMVDNFVWHDYAVTGMSDETKATFSVWPNPATEKINIDTENGIARVELISMSGLAEMVLNPGGGKSVVLHTSDLPRSIYLLRLVYVSGQENMIKVVLQ